VKDSIELLLKECARRAGLEGLPRSALYAAVVFAVVVCGWAVWRWWPTPQPRPVVSAAEAPSTLEEAPRADEASSSVVVVHVTGAVRSEGVYELAAGSRATDAVDAAGGLLGDAAPEAVNLARVLTDGEQLHIPTEDEQTVGGQVPAAGAPQPGAANSVVNINTADVSALDTLPGVGPSTAQKIVADRETNGPFASVDDLGRVSGIGPKRLEQLRELVCVQ
jgi:competence protein ComEA